MSKMLNWEAIKAVSSGEGKTKKSGAAVPPGGGPGGETPPELAAGTAAPRYASAVRHCGTSR